MTFNIINTIFISAFIDAFVDIFSFALIAWGVLYVVWGGFRAARRMFWIELEPWKARPQQSVLLEGARHRFIQRLAFSFDFFIAGFAVQLLTTRNVYALIIQLAVIALAVAVRVVLGFVTVRELRLSGGFSVAKTPVKSAPVKKASRKRTTVAKK